MAAAEEVGDVKLSVEDLIGEGKRHLLCNDPQSAVTRLSEACSIIGAEHGDLADELGPIYVLYGQALLESVRMESSVLGEKLVPGAEGEEGDDGESEDGADEEGDVAPLPDAEEADKSAEKEESKPANGGDPEAGASANGAEEQGADSSVAASSAAAAEGDDGAEGEEEEEEDADEDEGDRQIAWQVLDSARIILSRKSDKKSRSTLAEAHRLIGELCMEKEDFESAAADLQSALDIYLDIEPAGSRLTAEIFFTMGLVFSLMMKTEDAIKSYEGAIKCLRINIEKQEAAIADAQQMSDKAAGAIIISKAQDAIDSISSLMPDLLSKLEDQRSIQPYSEMSQQDLYKRLLGANANSEAASTSGAASSSSLGMATSAARTSMPPAVATAAAAGSEATEEVSSTFGSGFGAATKKTMSGQMARGSGTVNNIQHLVRKRKADESEKPAATATSGSCVSSTSTAAAASVEPATDAAAPAAKRVKPADSGDATEP